LSRTLQIPTARVFKPLLEPLPYKGAWGGRASGKSHFFAGLMVEDCVREPGETGEGLRCICIREVLKDLKESAKLLIEDKLQAHGLGEADGFKVFRDVVQTPKDGLIIFKGMQDYTAESVKSLEHFKRAWIEEAQTLQERSLALLRPTIRRSPGSQIWASWNPRRKTDAVDNFFRTLKPPGAVAIKVNWKDNPWFSKESEEERQLDLRLYPERYDHIWEGDYAKAFEGAYFASLLADARRTGRIGKVTADPLLPIRAFIDIGGSGATADAFTIWIVQWVGQEIRILDYYESVGQVLAFHVNWLRKQGYSDAILYLPHDGVNENNVTGKRYEDHLREAGFNVEPPVKNQGKGAASLRIEAVRRLGPKMYWNEDTTEAGRDAIGFYHERKDEQRNVGLGPEHDWSSHAADGLGLMAICYEEPGRAANFNRKIAYPQQGYA
jgi:phage terminase large subunit